MQGKIKESYEGINIVGSNNGFFDLDNCGDLIEKLMKARLIYFLLLWERLDKKSL